MAAIASFRAGGWSDTNTATNAWNAVPPTDADTVTITHVVTLDGLTCVCDALTINAGGDLLPSQTTNSKLVVDKGITQNQFSNALVTIDMSAVPQYTCTLTWNKDGDATGNTTNIWSQGGPYTLKGADKKNATLTDGALTGNTTTQCYVDDATGWRTGDILVFATTQTMKGKSDISAISYSGGELIVTANSHGVVVGEEVCLADVSNTNYNLKSWKVTGVTNSNVFRIAMADPSPITDQIGLCWPQAKTDIVTLSEMPTFDSGTTGRALIKWTDGQGTGGAVAHDHADNCVVANFMRNVILRPYTDLQKLAMRHSNSNVSRTTENVAYLYGYGFQGHPASAMQQTNTGLTNCAFFQYTGICHSSANAAGSIGARLRNNYYSIYNGAKPFSHGSQTLDIGPEADMVLLRSMNAGLTINVDWPFAYLKNPWISGVGSCYASGIPTGAALQLRTCHKSSGIDGGAIWSCTNILYVGQGVDGVSMPVRFNGTRINKGPTGADYSAATTQLITTAGASEVIFDNCPEYASTALSWTIAAGQEIFFTNRNGDQTVHEIYRSQSMTVPAIKRVTDAGDTKNAPSSLKMQWTGTTAIIQTRSITVLVSANETAKFIVTAKKNATYGSSTRPTIKAYDGATLVDSDTLTDSTAWETLSVDITNATAYDKEYRVELSGQSAVSGAACWFSGLPIAPFITRCRHYGYLFDETSPKRLTNLTIDAAISEATALAYGNSGTDIEVTWNTVPTASTTAIKVSTTFKKLYHFVQADATLNTSKAMPIIGVGVNSAPALFAAGNITLTDGAVLNGAGSIDIGAYTLATEFAGGVNYTYTGGTWSQLTTVPTFAGGILTLPTAITASPDFSMSTGTIVFGATSANWDLSTCTIGSGVLLSNTSGAPITVSMPSGYPTDPQGSGATLITVIAAVNTLTIAAQVSLLDAEVRVYDLDNTPAGSYGTELGGTESCSGATFSLPLSAANTVQIQILKDGYVEFTQPYTMGSTATFTAVLELDTYS